LYFSGSTCLFLLSGNVHDFVRFPGDDGDEYGNLSDFLAGQVFGSYDLVLQYDLARGLRPQPAGDEKRLQSMVQQLGPRLGEPATWPRDPETVLLSLDRFLERLLIEDDPSKRKRVALLFDYAQYLVPAGDLGSLARGQGTHLVRFLSWAQNPYIKRANIAFCLIAEKLSEVNDRLVNSPHVASIALPLPDRDERERFVKY